MRAESLDRSCWEVFQPLNLEPLAQTWIRCECPYSDGHNGLTSSEKNSKQSHQGRPEPFNLGFYRNLELR